MTKKNKPENLDTAEDIELDENKSKNSNTAKNLEPSKYEKKKDLEKSIINALKGDGKFLIEEATQAIKNELKAERKSRDAYKGWVPWIIAAISCLVGSVVTLFIGYCVFHRSWTDHKVALLKCELKHEIETQQKKSK